MTAEENSIATDKNPRLLCLSGGPERGEKVCGVWHYCAAIRDQDSLCGWSITLLSTEL